MPGVVHDAPAPTVDDCAVPMDARRRRRPTRVGEAAPRARRVLRSCRPFRSFRRCSRRRNDAAVRSGDGGVRAGGLVGGWPRVSASRGSRSRVVVAGPDGSTPATSFANLVAAGACCSPESFGLVCLFGGRTAALSTGAVGRGHRSCPGDDHERARAGDAVTGVALTVGDGVRTAERANR